MSELIATRLADIHKQFLSAAKDFPHLRLLAVRPHDSQIPWPRFPAYPDGDTLGLPIGEWRQLFRELDPRSDYALRPLSDLWLWIDGQLWQGALYYGGPDVDATELRALNDRCTAAILESCRLADVAANHFDLPAEPDYWRDGDGMLRAERSDRWIESLFSSKLADTCAGCRMQVRRLRCDVFTASARAVELLSKQDGSEVVDDGHATAAIAVARQAFADGQAIIAANLNQVLANQHTGLLIRAGEVRVGSTLAACRNRLSNALLAVRPLIPDLPSDAGLAPWSLGHVNDSNNPERLIGDHSDSFDGLDGALKRMTEFLDTARTNWTSEQWQQNIVDPVEHRAQQWNTMLDEAETRLVGQAATKSFSGQRPQESPPGPNTINESKPDGPQPPNLFRWRGKVAEMQSLPWKLARFLWTANDRRAESNAVCDAVWGHDSCPSSGALKSAISRANSALLENAIPISIGQKAGQVVLTIADG